MTKKPYLFADLETYSPVPIKNGTHAYAEQAEVMLFTFAFGNGPVECWDATLDPVMPAHLKAALDDPDQEIIGHNFGMFDSVVLKHALGVVIQPSRIIDTMAIAFSHGLPGGLDALCTILGVGADQAKQKTGHALILFFCKPAAFKHSIGKDFGTPAERRAEIERLKAEWSGRATRESHPAKWAEFIEYAKFDISATRAVWSKLPKWNLPNPNNAERALWVLDQKINQRGIAIDVPFAQAAVKAADRAKAGLAVACREATNEEVQAATQRDALLEHLLAEFGIAPDNLRKATVEKLLDSDIPEGLRELLNIRLQSSSTAVAKYNALIRGVSSDGRFRGTLQFSGAQRTKRWGSRAVQVQNLVKTDPVSIAAWCGIPFKDYKPTRYPTDEEIETYLATGIEAVLHDSADFFFDDVMGLLSNCIRGSFIAPPGKKLVVADMANIEGRMVAWLTGEAWKIQAFVDFDTFLLDDSGNRIPDGKGGFERVGPDLYHVSYGRAFGVDPRKVTKPQRTLGKILELACGFGGGVGAFFTFATMFNIDLDEMADNAIEAIPMEILRDSEGFMHWAEKKGLPKYNMTDKAYIVCNSFKMLWRQAHPETASYWKELGEAFATAILCPGEVITARRLKLQFVKGWVRILLPDSSYLCYPQAKIEENGDLSFMGMNQFSKRWERITTNGAKLFENVTQATARNVFASLFPLAENAGYEIAMHIHDEIVSEVPDSDEFTVDGLSKIMSTVPPWAQGLPLAAAGYEAARYRKD